MLKFSDFDVIDSRGYRAFVTPFDKLLDGNARRFGDDFNTAVRKVSDAAFYSEMFGFVLGKKAKVNALNSAGNQDFDFTYHSLILQQ